MQNIDWQLIWQVIKALKIEILVIVLFLVPNIIISLGHLYNKDKNKDNDK